MEQVGRSWGWALLYGLLSIVIGVLVMVWPSATLRLLAVLFGLELLLIGIYRLVSSFGRSQEHRVWAILLGIIAIFVGVIVLRNIWTTVIVITTFIGVFWIISGVVDAVMATSDKTYPLRAFTIFFGVIQLIAGIVIVSWPTGSATAMAWLLGVWFVILGFLGIVMAFLVKGAKDYAAIH